MSARLLCGLLVCLTLLQNGLQAADNTRSDSLSDMSGLYNGDPDNNSRLGSLDNEKNENENKSESVHSLELDFRRNPFLFHLLATIETPGDFDSYDERYRKKIEAEYPDFRDLLEQLESIGLQIDVKHEEFQSMSKRVIIQLSQPLAEDKLSEELKKLSVTYKMHTFKDEPDADMLLNRQHEAELKRILKRIKAQKQHEAALQASRVPSPLLTLPRGVINAQKQHEAAQASRACPPSTLPIGFIHAGRFK